MKSLVPKFQKPGRTLRTAALFILALGLSLYFAGNSGAKPGGNATGASKVDVCHIPPDDPDNYHTISGGQISY